MSILRRLACVFGLHEHYSWTTTTWERDGLKYARTVSLCERGCGHEQGGVNPYGWWFL